ncbi:MAG: tetratricopeptide repeat protein, partial [Candidatus Scalindua sp.]|nr:tetratricopeptide repeat protein [Candidatus Scalindua sp.]
MRKYLLHVLIISFIFLLAPTVHVASYAGEIEDAKEEVRKNPDDASAHYNLGGAYIKSGKWKEAIESYKQVLRIDPDHADAHFYLGCIYDELGKYQEAIESFKQAIRIDPVEAVAHFNLGYAYGELGKYEEAIESYKQVIRIVPDFADAHTNLGNAYNESGKWEEAREAWQQAIRIEPYFARAHNNLGCTYNKTGKHKKAIESYKKAISINPDDAEVHYNLGLAYYNTGKFQEAIESYKLAIRIKPRDEWDFYGHSTINHDYNLKAIKGDVVVVDNATGLMWHQSGSDEFIRWNKAKEWVRSLNSSGYAGHHDWRLPTVDEAVSLLESNKRNDLYIDPVFSNKQKWIWTGDSEDGSEAAWYVSFDPSYMGWSYVSYSNHDIYVRP